MKSLVYAFVVLCPLLLFAQLTPKSPDPGADWVAMIEIELPANPVDAIDDADAAVGILKLSAIDPGFSPDIDHSLSRKLWEVAKAGLWEMYADPELTKRLPFEEAVQRLSRPDTIVTINPATYEERESVIWDAKPLPFQAERLRARQLLTYHNASARFAIQTVAIAPCTDDGAPLYWLKVPPSPPSVTTSLVLQPEVTWAVRYQTEDSSPGVENWTEIKNTTGPVLERFLDRIRTDTTVQLRAADGGIIAAKDRRCLFSCTDTVIVFDPQTWAEKEEIAATGLDEEDVSELQLIEEWYWHNVTQRLTTRLVAVAPRYWVRSDKQAAFRRAAFFRRCDQH